jgi:hypothetical protein
MRRLAVAVSLAILAALGVVTLATAAPAPLPIRAAFYYPWFPETESWATRYTPALGKYDSSNRAILAAHVSMAKYAGLDAFIASYWGEGSKTAARLPLLLDVAAAQDFKITPYYEPASQSATLATEQADFDALFARTTHPGWLRVGGKPVLFTYNTGSEGSCAGVEKILQAAAGRFYVNAKVFSGYRTCPVQPDSWHQYGPAVGYDQQGSYAATVSPGFYKFNETAPRLARDLTRFKSDLGRQMASGAQWQLTTTFNEWGEGTSVEPAAEWQSTSGFGDYLDAMRLAYLGLPSPSPSPSPTPTGSPSPSETPTASPSVSASPTPTDSPTTPTASPTATPTVTPSPTPTTVSPTPTPTPTATPTPTPTPGQPVTKVLVFVEENHSLSQMQAGMPYLYGLAQRFSYASHYTAIRHPSLPNYLSIAGGDAFGVTDDAAPSSHVIHGASAFTVAAGLTSKTYAEGQTANCQQGNTGRYAVKHNPWAYFADERAACQANDVSTATLAADITANTLPNVGLVVPDLCNDAHDCSLATADNWLKQWLGPIMASDDFTSGRLAVVVTADEDNNTSANVVLTTVLHASLDGAHKVVTTPLTHFSLTSLLTKVGGSPCLRNGCTAPDMAKAFGLP